MAIDWASRDYDFSTLPFACAKTTANCQNTVCISKGEFGRRARGGKCRGKRSRAPWSEFLAICPAQRKRPCSFLQGLRESETAGSLVLRNQRLRCLRSPDLEADARPHVEAVR